MDIVTTARRYEITPEIREHVRKRLQKLERYLDGFAEVHVVLAQEKYRQIAEINVHARGIEIISREESDDMTTSIDKVVDRIERQVKRLTARRKERKPRRGAERPATEAAEAVEEEAAEEEAAEFEDVFAPVVIRQETYHGEPLTVEEAIELLRQQRLDYLLFPNKRDGRITLVYERPDGNYGLVEAP
ncbi:MAG: ribosome-associated translation inhibitor RaiA [Candidatus Eisenbacteria bacterium]|nr:ribosome-associated translation inhibitor RaiA [Candidatus Eisenbacteria bacterium]